MSVVVRPMGEAALLAEVDALDAVLALHAGLVASPLDGVVELVPAARTVLVLVDPARVPLVTARAWIERVSADAVAPESSAADEVVLEVVYDGEDLGETAALLGLSVDRLVSAHLAAHWRVAFTGFAPGFGYLVSDDWTYDVPRLASPRARVPAGSVGLAAGFSGAYPRETPGGWRLIGRTAARLFDATGDPASSVLLAPGARVRFRAVGGRALSASGRALPVPDLSPDSAGVAVSAEVGAVDRIETEIGYVDGEVGGRALSASGRALPVPDLSPDSAGVAVSAEVGSVGRIETEIGQVDGEVGGHALSEAPHPAHGAQAAHGMDPGQGAEARHPRPVIRVVEPGLSSCVQDLGRPGRAALGIARSGALDRAALRTANRLVGNAEDAAGIEVALGGLRARATRDTWFAVTGAWGAMTLDGHPIDADVAHAWPAGADLHLDWFAHGARAYLAVRGGLDVEAAVGSRSTDTLAGLGPAPLRTGDAIRIGPEPSIPIPVTDLAPWGAPPDELEVALAPGPRAAWFAPHALTTLFDAVWTVSAHADRVGIRLDGPPLERIRADELPSEGMVPGALQVPPSGRPTILLADGPVTGGYPVIAVVADAALDLLGQARPGTRIRFRHARTRVHGEPR